MTDKIEVTQRARNAAIRLLEAGEQDWQAKEVRLKEGDHFPIVQAFAHFERDILASTPDPTPVAVQGLVEALERIADERTLQSDLPGLPWTAQDIAALQSREIVLMRDIARAAMVWYMGDGW